MTPNLNLSTQVCQSIFYTTGDGTNYINIGLANGALYISTYMGVGWEPAVSYPAGMNFLLDDNTWHTVEVTRKVEKVNFYSHTSVN